MQLGKGRYQTLMNPPWFTIHYFPCYIIYVVDLVVLSLFIGDRCNSILQED
jgi:hypothetical protein